MEIKKITTDVPELDEILDVIFQKLNQIEIKRKDVAEKFKEMTIKSGSCVLVHPTFERSVAAFVVKVLIEIVKNMKSNEDKLKTFEFKDLITFDGNAPYIHLNEEKIKELKSDFKVDITNNKEISIIKNSISEFISVAEEEFKIFKHLVSEIHKHHKEALKVIEHLKDNFNKNDIQSEFQKVGNYYKITKSLVEEMDELYEAATLIADMMKDVFNTLMTVSSYVVSPNKFLTLINIARTANIEKIFDTKEIVFAFSEENKLRRFNDWENNFIYIKDETELKF